MAQSILSPVTHAETIAGNWNSLYRAAGVAALVALAANVLDVILGFGETEILINGVQTATGWFALYQENWFKGLYMLGLLNISSTWLP